MLIEAVATLKKQGESAEILDGLYQALNNNEQPTISNLDAFGAQECVPWGKTAETKLSNLEIQKKLLEHGTNWMIVENSSFQNCVFSTLLFFLRFAAKDDAIRVARKLTAEVARNTSPPIATEKELKAVETFGTPVLVWYLFVLMRFTKTPVVLVWIEKNSFKHCVYYPSKLNLSDIPNIEHWKPPRAIP